MSRSLVKGSSVWRDNRTRVCELTLYIYEESGGSGSLLHNAVVLKFFEETDFANGS